MDNGSDSPTSHLDYVLAADSVGSYLNFLGVRFGKSPVAHVILLSRGGLTVELPAVFDDASWDGISETLAVVAALRDLFGWLPALQLPSESAVEAEVQQDGLLTSGDLDRIVVERRDAVVRLDALRTLLGGQDVIDELARKPVFSEPF